MLVKLESMQDSLGCRRAKLGSRQAKLDCMQGLLANKQGLLANTPDCSDCMLATMHQPNRYRSYHLQIQSRSCHLLGCTLAKTRLHQRLD